MSTARESHSPAAPDLPEAPGTYRAGTLTYTFGGLAVLFAFLLLGDFAQAIRERCVSDLFQVLLRKYQVSDLVFGLLATAIPALMTLVMVPVVGIVSDNYRSRHGRRIPFLIITIPVVVIGILGLAAAPSFAPALAPMFGGGTAGARTATVMSLALFWAMFEAGSIIAHMLFGALINDVVPSRVIGRFFGIFRIIGLGAGILFNVYLFQFAHDWFATMFLVIAAIHAVFFSIMCWKVREGTYPEPPPKRVPAPSLIDHAVLYARTCLGVRFFAVLIVVQAVAALANIPINAFALKSAQAFGLDDAAYGQARAITYGCSLVLAFPLGWLSDIFHPLRTAFAATLVYGVAMVVGWLMVDGPRSFEVFFILHGVLSGAYFTTTLSLLPRLLPRAQYSQMAAGGACISMALVAVVSTGVGWLLDLTGKDYRSTFLLAGVIALVACAAWVWLFRQFTALGGLKAYTPPEPLGITAP